MTYIDADDFHENNHSLDVLQKIHFDSLKTY